MAQKHFGLPKQSRIKKRKDVDLLFTAGRRLTVAPLKAQWMLLPQKDNEPSLQVAFSVPKKLFKKATQRNRIKRLLRESWRLQREKLEPGVPASQKLAVFIIYTGTEMPLYNFVYEKISLLLQKLQLTLQPA